MAKSYKFGRRKMDAIETTGALAERIQPDGKRAIMLRNGERTELQRQRLVEGAVARFLDLERSWSWQQIADDLGITISMLKDLTTSPDFNDIWNQHFIELGHDPRYRRVHDELGNMLPTAVREMKMMLESAETPPTVKLKVIENIFKLNGVSGPKGAATDRNELTKFLQDAGLEVNATQVNIAVPPSYMDQVQKYMGHTPDEDVVEGDAHELPCEEAQAPCSPTYKQD